MTCLCSHPAADHPGGECVHRACGCHEFRLDPESPAAWLRSTEGEKWSRQRSEVGPLGRHGDAEGRPDRRGRGPVRTRTPHPGRDSSDRGSGMTWHCASCGTTLTWARSANVNPGMTKCPHCDKWMDRVTEDAATEETA